jgi:hypothetical protein
MGYGIVVLAAVVAGAIGGYLYWKHAVKCYAAYTPDDYERIMEYDANGHEIRETITYKPTKGWREPSAGTSTGNAPRNTV